MNPDAVANKMTAALMFAVALILPQSTMAKDAVQSREYPQAAFAGVSVHIPADIEIRPAPRNSVTVSAELKVLQALRLSVRNGVLNLDSGSYQTTQPVKILVEGKPISSLAIQSSGTITVREPSMAGFTLTSDSSADVFLEGINGDSLKLELNGSETVKINGKVQRFELKVEGSSSVDASRLLAQSVSATASGASTVNVNAVADLRAIASESATLKYRSSGRVKKQSSDAAEIVKIN